MHILHNCSENQKNVIFNDPIKSNYAETFMRPEWLLF